jgi:hypothetical protein
VVCVKQRGEEGEGFICLYSRLFGSGGLVCPAKPWDSSGVKVQLKKSTNDSLKDKMDQSGLMGAHRKCTIVRFVASIEWTRKVPARAVHKLFTRFHEWD